MEPVETPVVLSSDIVLPREEREKAVWQQVVRLAWPVLTRQFLVLAVDLSDRFLAGYFEPPDASQHLAYQSAQTTAIYLAWFISTYTYLVSVGSTALVARFVRSEE